MPGLTGDQRVRWERTEERGRKSSLRRATIRAAWGTGLRRQTRQVGVSVNNLSTKMIRRTKQGYCPRDQKGCSWAGPGS